MIKIHQATYGEKGGHNLLKSTFIDSSIPKRLSGFTDLVDRPPSRVLSKPMIRGFFEDGYYLLIKSFADLTPGIRPGRVFSHALIIEKKDFLKIHDVMDLLRFHFERIDKEKNLEVINYKLEEGSKEPQQGNKVISAVNAVADHTSFDNTVIWVGEDGYENFISVLWPNLPNQVKLHTRIGEAYDPKFVDQKLLNLLRIPASLKANWSKKNYAIVEGNTNTTLESQTAKLLIGDSVGAEDLLELKNSYNIEIKEIEDFQLFESFIEDHQKIDSSPNFKQLLILTNLISRRNPSKKSGREGKKKLLQAIIRCIPAVSVTEFKALEYQTWNGFENADSLVSDSIRKWLEVQLFTSTNSKEKAKLVNEALLKNDSSSVLTQTICEFAKTQLSIWKDEYAAPVWTWILFDTALLKTLEVDLPDSAEDSLVDKLPVLSKAQSKELLSFSKQKKWLKLHGIVAVQTQAINKAIEEHLVLDKDQEHTEVLEMMSKLVSAKEFLKQSSVLNDERLHKISGRIVYKNINLRNKLEVNQIGWQLIWLNSIKEGADVWTGIKDPYDTLYLLLDQVQKGNFSEELLLEISKDGNFIDIVDYPQRKDLWEVLPTSSLSNFLQSTAQSVLSRYLHKEMVIDDIEENLIEAIISDDSISMLMNEHRSNIEAVLSVFEGFPGLKDQFLADYVFYYSSDINDEQANRLGILTNQLSFRNTARSIYDKAKYNASFTPAYYACKNLVNLSFFEQMFDRPRIRRNTTHNDLMESETTSNTDLQTVVILTAIKYEYQAVRKHLTKVCDADKGGTIYEGGVFVYQGKEVANVVIRECGAKNTTASQEAERAINNFDPDIILFVGIAGSRKPNDFQIGDVIVPDKVYYYEGGKAKKKDFLARPDTVSPSFELLEKAKRERSKDDWKSLIKDDYGRSPDADLGIIASGEQLIEHHSSKVGDILTKHYNDTSAVEMEGYGFLKAIQRQGDRNKKLISGIIRGISDIIESEDLDQSDIESDRRPKFAQRFASDTAAAFAFWLILKHSA